MVSGFLRHITEGHQEADMLCQTMFFDAHSKQHVHRLLVTDNINMQYILNLFKHSLMTRKSKIMK